MNFLRSRVLLLLGASLLAAASAFLFVFFPAGRKAGAVPAAPPAIPANAGGELEFAETDIDLGLVNAPIKHAIEFTNRSDRVVRIGKIVTSCNCTTTQPDKQVLQPGERGRVLLNIEPRVDHVSQSRHLITVEYEGAEPRQAHLQVHYLTRPDVVVPHEVEIRSTGAHDVAVSFTVVDFRDKPLKIATISTSSPGLRARVAQEPSSYLPGWEYRLEVSYAANDRPPGEYAETILLHTDDPDRQTILVRAAIHQVSRFRVAPSVLHLTAAPGSADAVGTVFVDDIEGDAVEIESLAPSEDAIHCTVGGASPHQTVEVRVSKGDLPRLTPSASVRVVLKKPSSEVLCVHVVP